MNVVISFMVMLLPFCMQSIYPCNLFACYVNQCTHCKCELGRVASKWRWCWKSCVQHELNAEGTMIKEEVQGYALPLSGSHVLQISLDVGTSLQGNDQHEVCWYGDELLTLLVCFFFRSIQNNKFSTISFAFWVMFLNDRSLSTCNNYNSCLIKCQLWDTYSRHYN
jgi:hypothetical protein